MKYLYGRTRKRIDVFTYGINAGREDYIKIHPSDSKTISLTFIDGKFSDCSFQFGVMTRSHWLILSGVGAEIKSLEQKYKNGKL